MAGNNDILATVGVSQEDFLGAMSSMERRLDGIEKAGSKAASGIQKVEKSANLLKNIKMADVFNSALEMMSGAGGEATRAMNVLGNSAMIARNNFDDAGGASVALNNSFGRLVDVVSAIPGPVGMAASGIGTLLKVTAEAKDRQDEFNDAMAHGAESTAGILQKFTQLTAQQKKEASSSTLILSTERLNAMAREKNRLAAEFAKETGRQIALEKDLTIGAKQRLDAHMAEKEAAQKIADLAASQRERGITSAAGKKIVEAGAEQIEAELELRKKTLAVSEAEAKIESSLTNEMAKRTETAASALKINQESAAAAQKLLTIVEKQGLGKTKQADDLRLKINDLRLAEKELFIAKQQQEANIALNKDIASRGILVADELAHLKKQREEMEKMRDLAAGTFGPGSEQATQRDAALRNLAFQEKALTLGKKEQESQIALNKDAATRTALLFDQLEHQQKINQKLAEMKELSAQTYGEESPQFAKASKDLQEGKNAERQMILQRGFADAEKRHNENLQQRNVTLKSQSDILDSQIYMEKDKLATLEAQADARDEHAIAAQKAAVTAAELEKKNFDYQHGKELEQQKLNTATIDSEILGNKKLADLARIRAQRELEVADAIRNQNAPLAKEIAQQQALEELQARAADLAKTPAQQASERKQQMENNRLIRLAAAREKDKEDRASRGAKNQIDSRDWTSTATEKAVQGFADRNQKRILGAAERAVVQAQNFKAETLTVNQIKNAP